MGFGGVMFRVCTAGAVGFAVALASGGWAEAADQPKYGPPPSWVKPIDLPKDAPGGASALIQILLADTQIRFGPAGDEAYVELAARAVTPQSLEVLGNFTRAWNPDTETVTIHKLRILRGDQVIDLLAQGKKMTVLRREQNLEQAVLDGTLTATLQLEDLRVGDILDLATTTTRRDPVLQGRSQGGDSLIDLGAIARFHVRALWTADKAVRWRTTAGLDSPSVAKTADGSELLIDLKDVRAPKAPRLAPARFRRVGQLELSQFKDWAEVSSLMAPLYAKAGTIEPRSSLAAEIAKIAAASRDPMARAFAALKLVEDQTRYVFLGMNFGGYVPAAADLTWSRKFGDCKGKTALLLALLRGLGIEAQAALVSTTSGDGLDEHLPRLDLFDHVLVRAAIGGKVYWLDGTQTGDRNLEDIPVPAFDWALPVQPEGAKLEKLVQRQLVEPGYEEVMRLDASAGLDAPAPAHVEEIYRGERAIAEKLLFSSIDKADADRHLREAWTRDYPWIKIDKVGWSYDEASGAVRRTMDGSATMDWTRNHGARDFYIRESNLGWKASFLREPGPNADAPYAVDYPDYRKWTVTIRLPDRGLGFGLVGGQNIDKTVAGIAFWRRSRIDGELMVTEATQKSVAEEFPASDAPAAATALRSMSDYDVVLRKSGGGVESVEEGPVDAPAPTDAPGFGRRGLSHLTRGEFQLAIQDISRAVALSPEVASYRYNRGVVYFQMEDYPAAIADFSEALRLKPTDRLALMARGGAYLMSNDETRAEKDFDAVIAANPEDSLMLARRADAFERAKHFEKAVELYDAWLTRFPADPRRVVVLTHRCLATVGWGRKVDTGLADCKAAAVLKPEDADVLLATGAAHLRLAQYDLAIGDFDRVLAVYPTSEKAQFGLGLAKLGKGQKAEGEQDIASARSADPSSGAMFAHLGLKP